MSKDTIGTNLATLSEQMTETQLAQLLSLAKCIVSPTSQPEDYERYLISQISELRAKTSDDLVKYIREMRAWIGRKFDDVAVCEKLVLLSKIENKNLTKSSQQELASLRKDIAEIKSFLDEEALDYKTGGRFIKPTEDNNKAFDRAVEIATILYRANVISFRIADLKNLG